MDFIALQDVTTDTMPAARWLRALLELYPAGELAVTRCSACTAWWPDGVNSEWRLTSGHLCSTRCKAYITEEARLLSCGKGHQNLLAW